jgi:hypothetical protein
MMFRPTWLKNALVNAGTAAFTCNQLWKLIEIIAKGVHRLF